MNYEKVNYKYRLTAEESVDTGIKLKGFKHEFFELSENGILTIKVGYMWDGCSSIAIDDSTNMRAGLFHDALYQAIREGLLLLDQRKKTDKLFYKVLREDGMFWLRAKYYYRAVRIGGAKHCKPLTDGKS